MAQEGVEELALYKKGLAGILLDYQAKVHEYLGILSTNPQQSSLEEINAFLWKSFGLRALPKTRKEAYDCFIVPFEFVGW